jgi:carbonic anhydrase
LWHGAVLGRDHGRSARRTSSQRSNSIERKWSNPHHKGGHAAGHFIKWHTIKNQKASVAQDVWRIREHPLVPHKLPIYGYVYDVKIGRLNEVKTVTEPGKAAAV